MLVSIIDKLNKNLINIIKEAHENNGNYKRCFYDKKSKKAVCVDYYIKKSKKYDCYYIEKNRLTGQDYQQPQDVNYLTASRRYRKHYEISTTLYNEALSYEN